MGLLGDHREVRLRIIIKKVRVRVCRLWEAVNTKDDTLISMYMILVDEKGNLMHAVVRKHLVLRFKRRVSEGLVYSFIRNLKATINTYQYRPLASVQKLLFLKTTEVVELGEDVVHILKYGFQFIDFTVLRSRAEDVTTLSDIVGCFCGFGKVEVVGAGFKKEISRFSQISETLLGREFVLKLRFNKYNLIDGLQDYGTAPNPMEFTSAADNVWGGGNERKRKLSPVIEAISGGGSGVP